MSADDQAPVFMRQMAFLIPLPDKQLIERDAAEQKESASKIILAQLQPYLRKLREKYPK